MTGTRPAAARRVSLGLLAGCALAAGALLPGPTVPTADAGVLPVVATTPAGPAPVLGSRTVQDARNASAAFEIRVDLNEVRVDGDRMHVTVTATNLGPAGKGAWQVADFFGDDGRLSPDVDSVSGLQVLDPVAAQRYAPGFTAGRHCLCTDGLNGASVARGSGHTMTAVFAAPPAGAEQLEVFVPHVGFFSGITPTTGPADPALVVEPLPDERVTDLPVRDILFPSASADGNLVAEGGGGFRLAADVLFDFDRSELKPAAQAELARFVDLLRKDPAAADAPALEVSGYTDDVGADAYNQRLSGERAESVRAALASVLGPDVRLTAVGRGETGPIADNGTDAGRALNRRVEIRVG